MWWCDDNYLIICQHQAHPEEDNEKLCRPPSLCSVILLLLGLSQPLPSFDIKHRGKRRGKCGKLFIVPSVGRRNNKEEK